MFYWTNTSIEKLLLQLESKGALFEKYRLAVYDGSLKLLGSGSFAMVYEAVDRKNIAKNKKSHSYALKVIGFGGGASDSISFWSASTAQEDISFTENHIIRIYAIKEIVVFLDDNNDLEGFEEYDPDIQEYPEREGLSLKLVLMEKAEPVISSTISGAKKLYPDKLAEFDEEEIIKLAKDIGRALKAAHDANVLHRDVKLENTFYSSKTDCYKLGDFGIARKTDDGMASTVAFTRGYGAPEVVTSKDEKYDATADIYSFGMLLFVLLNELKFPGSEGYSVNFKNQYRENYRLPRPKRGSDKFADIVVKMCAYAPENRYSSMDEVLADLAAIGLDERSDYQRKHKNSVFPVAILFMIAAAVACKLTFAPGVQLNMPFPGYVAAILSIMPAILEAMKRKDTVIRVILAAVLILILVKYGFSWPRMIVFLTLVTFPAKYCMCVGLIVLSANFASLFQNGGITGDDITDTVSGSMLENAAQYRWVAISLIEVSWAFFGKYIDYYHREMGLRGKLYSQEYHSKDTIYQWLLLGVMLIIFGFALKYSFGTYWIERILSQEQYAYICGLGLEKAGMVSMLMSVFWIARVWVLERVEKRKGIGLH
ncbi:MAG: protein kinase [Lachnospiraceae bacterium]|nr:protein kinase [Lachnospiraceae bacterium]